MKSLLIPEILRMSRSQLQCDRALVAKLHGSSVLDINNSFFSVSFESLSEGCFSLKGIVKNIPRRVLDYEFSKGNLDYVSVANKPIHILKEDEKCYKHLDTIGCKVIVNQLLHVNSYIWGILSFQYKECPSYINGTIIEDKYMSIIKEQKRLILTNFTL